MMEIHRRSSGSGGEGRGNHGRVVIGFTQLDDDGDRIYDFSDICNPVAQEDKGDVSVPHETKSMNSSQVNDIEIPKKFVGISMIQQVEDTIKVGKALEKGVPDHRPILLKESMKLQHLKQVIREWISSKTLFDNQLRKEHQSWLSFIDVKMDQGTTTREDLNCGVSLNQKLSDIERTEVSDLAQKYKIKWAIKGAKNSSFFHGSLKMKRRQIAIKGVFKNGIQIEEPGEVKEELYDHFCSRFSYSRGGRPSLREMSFNQIALKQRESLESDFTNDEIKRAVWDGGGIVLRVWMVSHLSASKLSGRLFNLMVIGSCVIVKQSTFIKGRNILDGPLILNECMSWYRKRKKDLMVFKVDFEKAYDSLRWDYLDVIMKNLGFGNKRCTWIQGCLKNSCASILVNGSPIVKFKIFKGLRQGGPLSPFLFILTMEGLHATICKAVSRGILKGASVGRGIYYTLPPFYANDAIFVGVNVPDGDVVVMAKVLRYGVSKLPMIPNDLWVKEIKDIHRSDGAICRGRLDKSSQSPWNAILRSVHKLQMEYLLAACYLSFWGKKWCGDHILKDLLPRVYALDGKKTCTFSQRISSLDWNSVLRRSLRGGVELNQFTAMLEAIRDFNLSDSIDGWKGGGGTPGGGDVEDEEVSLVDGVFEGTFRALGLEMKALVDAMEVYGDLIMEEEDDKVV
nr:hypothetical protein [Tanacetum cinerariifolium]